MRSLLALATVLATLSTVAAQAGDRFGPGAYRGVHPVGGYPSYGYGGYGFAGEAIGGAYIGAPLTRFPRPTEIVPPAWGYGTYGVPTVTGIRQAPTAQPTVYVIDTPARVAAPRRPIRSRVLSRAPGGDWSDAAVPEAPTHVGPRIVSVTVAGR